MDTLLNSDEARDTKMKWAIDYADKFNCQRPSFFTSVTGWEGIVDKLHAEMESRKDRLDLVKQCRVVGLMSKASELEQSISNLTEKELNDIYNAPIMIPHEMSEMYKQSQQQ